jgi:GNAT superfamily N-acetyltransferase
VSVPDVRPITEADPEPIARTFAAVGWPGKGVGQYHRYLGEQAAGTRAVRIGSVDGRFAGYLTVCWAPGYEPFRAAGVPEIQDLNVLPSFRRRGVASALMDAAEALIGVRGDTAGIGVGLYAAYAAAHLMYLRRGYRPDGHGVVYRGVPVAPGTTVPVDDDLALMMTRRLRPAGAAPGPGRSPR